MYNDEQSILKRIKGNRKTYKIWEKNRQTFLLCRTQIENKFFTNIHLFFLLFYRRVIVRNKSLYIKLAIRQSSSLSIVVLLSVFEQKRKRFLRTISVSLNFLFLLYRSTRYAQPRIHFFFVLSSRRCLQTFYCLYPLGASIDEARTRYVKTRCARLFNDRPEYENIVVGEKGGRE